MAEWIRRRVSATRRSLYAYDALILLISNILLLNIFADHQGPRVVTTVIVQIAASFILVFLCRSAGSVYKQIWRFGGSGAYIRLIGTDAIASVLFAAMQTFGGPFRISYLHAISIGSVNLLATLLLRHIYQYMYENAGRQTLKARLMRHLVSIFAGIQVKDHSGVKRSKRIKIAIVGAGRIGVMLAEELKKNPRSVYEPCCFIDIDKNKVGREIIGLPVIPEDKATPARLDRYQVQEIVYAPTELSAERKKRFYDYYQSYGCKLMVYDFPMKNIEADGKRQLREFDIEELLFRQPLEFTDKETRSFYQGKCILITGGGGSIGSELCRQIAKMKPSRVVVLDINENDVYDLQQSIKMSYGSDLDLRVEIASICDRQALEQVFGRYQPQIVLHAAAHKHVPLMESNCCEAVKNNVFGTLNVVETAEKFGVEKFIMLSTDKAVNPTNVMGATKRMCEMIIQSRTGEKTKFSATRFGNVLGSRGSVIPLFERQIRAGGPVTLTDKRIIRYFMTISEASQLVLQSGAMAKNGQLYVLDMGKPVKILDLAESMIRLSGYEPYNDIDIVETGLRPGEKLYEELLVKPGELQRTNNELIFVEQEIPVDSASLQEKLDILRQAIMTNDDEKMRDALKRVVLTFRAPEEINANAKNSEEMKRVESEQQSA
ncbi:MAG: polysaccharide biosynthesis protein [Clostridia bacterium]|nr:polysaccharide biosynthesis protein [Clostridia bacterium]